MTGLPALLNLAGRRCLIVGGGAVARRRAGALLDAGAAVSVVAPAIDDAVRRLAVEAIERPFEAGDLDGVFLVVIATDDAAVNESAAAEAASRGVLTNRADDPEAGDVTIPAHRRRGPVTVAVDTGGASAAAARRLVESAAAGIDPVWPELLERALPWRREIQRRFADRDDVRAALLRALTDPRSMTILECRGGDAVEDHWRRLIEASA